MKPASTLFLKAVVLLMAVPVIAFCAFALPEVLSKDNFVVYRPVIIGIYLAAIPFFYALYQALKLLTYIDQNKSFSELSVRAIQRIKLSSVTIGAITLLFMPYTFIRAQVDDAPGVVAIALLVLFAASVVSTFAAVLQKLIQNAVDLQSENDLTV